MTSPTRRSFLALGAGVVGAAAGCLGGTVGSPRTSPESATPAETTGASEAGAASLSFDRAERLHRVDAAFPQRDVADYYLALLTTRDHAAAFPADSFGNESASAFVADTDFSCAAIVVLQDRRSSSHPDLELLDARRERSAVTIAARYPGEGATADVATDTLLVRVPDCEGSLRSAGATVDPRHGEPVRIETGGAPDDAPTFDRAGDLVVRNRDCAGASPSVTVTRRGSLAFRGEAELAPASHRRVEGLFARPGEWTVAVRVGGETTARTWSLTDDPPGDVLVAVDGDGAASLSRRPDGVDGGDVGACETDGRPYESSDPVRNVADPVDLWLLDRSDGAHRLRVSIRDSDADATAFREEFVTREGYDKVRRGGLLAKRATYVVEVSTGDGRSVAESVTVRRGGRRLVVRVTETGELRVSMA